MTPEADQERKDLAACITRVFLGNEDGKRVLAYLRRRFGVERTVFRGTPDGHQDPIQAAIREGERHVMIEIEAALKSGNPQAWAESQI